MAEDLHPPFTVTRAAIEQLSSAGGSVRVDLAPTGCCGRAYTWSADPPQAGDRVFGCPGALLAVSPAAGDVLTGARVDYGASLKPPRFRVVANPNTPLRCPCNRSFGRAWPGRGQPSCQATAPMPWNG